MTFDSMDTLVKKDTHSVVTNWRGKMHFESIVNDHIIHMDKLAQHGGDDLGPRPKPLFLSTIGGCTGMEIMAILEKMRVKVDAFNVEITGELNDGTPKMYKAVDVVFNVTCAYEAQDKVRRSIDLAVEKYCGVLAMFRKFADVSIEIKFNDIS